MNEIAGRGDGGIKPGSMVLLTYNVLLHTLSHLTFPEPGEEAVYLGCFTMDGGAWFTFTFTFHFHALEKEMATHSSVLAWRIPGTGEPVGLPSLGSYRVGHD